MSIPVDRRGPRDRRRVPRGGRREYDQPGRHPAVLVADSYDGARRPFVRYLDRFNFDVAEVSNGEDALKQIASTPPRVIVTEWQLPSMPADQLCQWLSQGSRTRDIPVIVVAADFDARRRMPGVAAILVKPFSLESMLAEVRRALRESRSGFTTPL